MDRERGIYRPNKWQIESAVLRASDPYRRRPKQFPWGAIWLIVGATAGLIWLLFKVI